MAAKVVFVALLVVCSVQAAFGQKVDPRREPGTAILEAVRLLERKDHVAFIETFFPPDELKESLLKYKTVKEMAAAFERQSAFANMMLALQAASTMKPALDAKRTRADYRFAQPVGGSRRLQLAKVGEFWFIDDF